MPLNLKAPLPPKPEPVAEPPEEEQPKAKKNEKKKDEKDPNKKYTLMEILAAVRKEKGDKVIVQASKIPKIQRLQSGVFEFDFFTGGGFPRGRYSIIYGPESSCKTNICLSAIATAQREPAPRNKAIYVSLEQSFDPVWALKLGVDIDELLVVNPGYGEEAVDLVDALVRADDVNIIVVDSLAALIASKEIAQSVEKYDIGSSALLIKRMANKLMIAFSEEAKKDHFPTVLFINQTRFKPGVMFGDPETMPGGEAVKFLASLRIRFNAKNAIDKKTAQLQFKEVHAVVKKSKIPVRAMSFDFQLCVAEGGDIGIGDTDSFNMVKGHLQALGMLEKTNKGYQITGYQGTFPTLATIQDMYRQDWQFRMALQKLVIDAHSQDQMFLVDEPQVNPEKSLESGEAVQSIA